MSTVVEWQEWTAGGGQTLRVGPLSISVEGRRWSIVANLSRHDGAVLEGRAQLAGRSRVKSEALKAARAWLIDSVNAIDAELQNRPEEKSK